jgi:acyl carrier protein
VGTLGAETSLLEAGVIDSTGVLELIGFLEDTFGIAIPDDDLVPANFDTIGSIVRYLERNGGA